jgi:hypothetical protein
MSDEDRTGNGADTGTHESAAENVGGDSANSRARRGTAKDALIRRASGERVGHCAGQNQHGVSRASALRVDLDATEARLVALSRTGHALN